LADGNRRIILSLCASKTETISSFENKVSVWVRGEKTMMVYYSIGLILTLFAVLEILESPKIINHLFLCFSFVVLALLAGLRGRLFSDYGNYVVAFYSVYDLSDYMQVYRQPDGIHGEFLYLFYNTFLRTFTDNPIYLFLTFAFLAVGINLYCFEKFSPYPLVSVLLYFSHTYLYKELVQIRAGLACALVLYSVTFIQKRKALQYVLTVFIAAMIHTGAIVVLPVYWLCKMRFSKTMLFLPLIIGLLLAKAGWLSPFLGFLKNMNALHSGVEGYMEVEGYNYSLGILNPMTLKQALICSVGIYYKDVLVERFKYFYPLLVMYILSTAWILAFQEFAILAARIATFFSVGDPLLLTYLVTLFREKKIVLAGVIMMAWALLFLNVTIKQGWPPYHTIFDLK
jgi:hypothetical protein